MSPDLQAKIIDTVASFITERDDAERLAKHEAASRVPKTVVHGLGLELTGPELAVLCGRAADRLDPDSGPGKPDLSEKADLHARRAAMWRYFGVMAARREGTVYVLGVHDLETLFAAGFGSGY
jgi:hypothetical protein